LPRQDNAPAVRHLGERATAAPHQPGGTGRTFSKEADAIER